MTEKTKVCKTCKVLKPHSEYQKAGGGKWLQPYCKPCDAERKRAYDTQNKEKVKQAKREYYIINAESIKKRDKLKRDLNPEANRQRVREYKKKNPDIVRLKAKEYARSKRKETTAKRRLIRSENKAHFQAKGKATREKRTPKQREKIAEYMKEYRIKNAEKIKARRAERLLDRREKRRVYNNYKSATDITFRIIKNLRNRTRLALKNLPKSDTTEKLLGCTIPFFKEYFESLFTDGMTWEAFMSGNIHIDHIRPCSAYDLSKEDEQRACFFYKNLQPLWWEDNLKKGAKYG